MRGLALDRVEDFSDSKHEEILNSGPGIVDSRVIEPAQRGQGWTAMAGGQLAAAKHPSNSRQPKAQPVIKLRPGAAQKITALGVDDRDSIGAQSAVDDFEPQQQANRRTDY